MTGSGRFDSANDPVFEKVLAEPSKVEYTQGMDINTIETITASDVMDWLRAIDAKETAAWHVACYWRGIITWHEMQDAIKCDDNFDVVQAITNLQRKCAKWIEEG